MLAVDIPSGVDGLTGRAPGDVLAADATVTFAALKPGLVLPPGLELAGEIEVADIGLDVSRASAHLVGAAAVAGWLPDRSVVAHKWQSAVWVVAGSPGMGGAASLARPRPRPGPAPATCGCPPRAARPPTSRSRSSGSTCPADDWADRGDRRPRPLLGPRHRQRPGHLAGGRRRHPRGRRRRHGPRPAHGRRRRRAHRPRARRRRAWSARPPCSPPTTASSPASPASPPGADRIAAARSLAARTGAVVLLKGRATVVADPDGEVLVTTTGDARLATAGTGDVLAGVIGGLLGEGIPAAPRGRGRSVPPRSGRRPRLAPRPGGRRPADRPARRPRRGRRPAALNHGPRPGGPMLLRDTPVRDLMVTEVLTFTRRRRRPATPCGPWSPRDIDGAPVVDDENYVIGSLSTGDLIVEEANIPLPAVITLLGGVMELPKSRKQYEDDLGKALGATVGEVMQEGVVAILGPDDTLEDAATVMHDEDLDRVPVVRRGRPPDRHRRPRRHPAGDRGATSTRRSRPRPTGRGRGRGRRAGLTREGRPGRRRPHGGRPQRRRARAAPSRPRCCARS